MTILITLGVFLIILTILVLVHEIGHFYAARKFGIAVEEFGIGLPPRAFGIKKKNTIFSLNWIPLGGFVKIKGEQGEHEGDEDSFSHKPIWQRGVVLAAGVSMNVLLAAVLLTIGFIVGAPQILGEKELSSAAIVRNDKIQIVNTFEGYPAYDVLHPGDIIHSINGVALTTVEKIQAFITEHAAEPLTFSILRDEATILESITAIPDTEVARSIIGVELVRTGIVSYPITHALVLGPIYTVTLLKDILLAFGDIISNLFRGEEIGVELSGPVGIAFITAEVTRLGISYIIQFAALLSLNLAIINFIPFPALDGGRFMFLMIEKIKGKAVNQRYEGYAHTAGFVLLISLILIVTYQDITKYSTYFNSFWSQITSLF